MPLTSVIEYLEQRLHELHPASRLSAQAGFRYRQGHLTAGIACFRLIPDQVPVVRVSDGAILGYSAQLRVESSRGHPMKPEALYVHAWDAEDVIFLDRFLRTFHALHHLNLGHDSGEWLVVGVHLRHLGALPEQHGQVFLDLLHRLGIASSQVVLRLQARALQRDPHVQAAARSFVAHGYRLLALRPDRDDTDWALLRALGVGWVAPDVAAADFPHRWHDLVYWAREARDQGVGLWVDRVGTPEALGRARELGADLAEGELLRPVAAWRAGAVS